MNEPSVSTCPTCGRPVPTGESCFACADSKIFRLIHREIWLLALLAMCATALYFGTRAFANTNRDMKLNDGKYWYQEGQRRLRSGHPDEAVAAFRRASLDDRGNHQYVRALAQALENDGRDAEARELLLQEREGAPESPEINVALARIAAKQHDESEAVRYYHNALYGIWTGDDVDARRRAIRRELIEFLISQHARDQALAEIFTLSGRQPNTVDGNNELGSLFLEAGDAGRALGSFRLVLRAQSHNAVALEGAGKAAFQLGNYQLAQRYLAELASPSPAARQLLNTVDLINLNNPIEPRLSFAERRRRAKTDFEQASERLEECIAINPQGASSMHPLQDQQQELEKELNAAHPQEQPELVFRALDFVYQVESAASKSCGPSSDMDSALLLIAQKSRGAEP